MILPPQHTFLLASNGTVLQQAGRPPGFGPTTPLQQNWVMGLYWAVPQSEQTVPGTTVPPQHTFLLASNGTVLQQAGRPPGLVPTTPLQQI